MSMELKIRIGSQADTTGLNKAEDAVEELRSELKRADQAADEFIQSIKMGVGIDLGGRLVQSIASIPGLLQGAISRGVEFNRTMMDSEIGISNVLAKFMGLNQEAARGEAAKAMQKIIELEPKTAAGLSDLVQGFLATVAASQSAGISVEENIDLVGKFANALANANIPAEQLSQELRAIMTGNITPDASLAKILQLSNEDINKAKEAGNLYQLLVERLGSLGNAGDSASVRLSTLNSSIEKTLGAATEPIFDVWMESLGALNEVLADDQVAKDLQQVGYQIAALVKSASSLSVWAVQNAPIFLGVAKAVGAIAAAWMAYQVTAIVVGLNRKAAAILGNKAALDAETAALAANTAGQRANAASRAAGAAGGAGRGAGGSNLAAAGGIGLGLGLIGYDLLSSKAAEINAASDRSNELGKMGMSIAQQYGDAIKSASSLADKESIIKGLTSDIAKLREQALEASEEDAEMINRMAGLLDRMLGTARNISDEKLRAKEADTEAAAEAERQAAQLAANAEIMAADAARRRNADADRIADQKLDGVGELIAAGEIDAAKARIDELAKYYQDWLNQIEIDPSKQTEDELKKAMGRRDQIEGFLRDVANEEKRLTAAREQAAEKEKAKAISELRERIQLEESRARARLAEIEASGQNERKILEERVRIEDELARKRLDLENQIGTLAGESALAREARQLDFKAGDTQRQASLKASPETGRSPLQERFAQEDAFNALSNKRQLQVQRDMLDKYGLNPRNADGSKFTPEQHFAGLTPVDNLLPPKLDPAWPGANPQSPGSQGTDPVASAEAAASAAEEAASAAEEAGDKMAKALDKTASALGELPGKIESVIKETSKAATAASEAVGTLQGTMAELRSRLTALENAAA